MTSTSADVILPDPMQLRLKAKFGAALRSKTDVAQINELLCKVLCHNLCCVMQSIYELGVEPVSGAGTRRLGAGLCPGACHL
jgi:hypothetical protein